MIELLDARPALPVRNIERSAAFYRDFLGFTIRHQEPRFAIACRDAVEIHLWLANDDAWRERKGETPAVSGAESFIAGTASCRVRVTGVEALYEAIRPHGVIHNNAPLATQPWGDRDFATVDPDGNLVTFFENEGMKACRLTTGCSGRSAARPATEPEPSLAPWLMVRQAGRAVNFYMAAFSAQPVYRIEDRSGNVVARLRVGESEFWVSDESPEHGNTAPETLGGTSVKLLLTVPDPDAVFARAIAAGASQVYAVQEGHGWRVGRVVDPFGHHWEIGHPLEPDAAANEATDPARPAG